MKTFNPAWLFHKSEQAKIFECQESFDKALANGWVDSPKKVQGSNAKATTITPAQTGTGKESSTTTQEPPAGENQTGATGSGTDTGSSTATDYSKLLVPQLKEALIAKGVPAELVIKMKKEELLQSLAKV